MKKEHLIIVTAILVLLVSVITLWKYTSPRKVNHNVTHEVEKVAIGGAFTLLDTDRNPINDEQFRGKYMLVYFGFSYCPDVCPLTLDTLGEALSKLGEEDNNKLQAIFITLDPSRDTPEVLKQYMSHFHPRILALTGSKQQIDAAATTYKVYVAKAQSSKENDPHYLLDHSSFIYFMDPEGNYITHFHHDISAEAMVEAIKAKMQP